MLKSPDPGSYNPIPIDFPTFTHKFINKDKSKFI